MPFDPLVFDGHVFAANGPASFDCVFDRAIFDGRIFDTCEDVVVVVIDTHDGGRQRRGWKKRRIAREKLRRQIQAAIDGPQARVVRRILEPVGGVLQADVQKLTETDYKLIAEAYQAALDDEEDIEMLLLGFK